MVKKTPANCRKSITSMDGSKVLQSPEATGTSCGWGTMTGEGERPYNGCWAAENKHTDVAEIKDQITPQLITKTSVMMMKSCCDWCGQAAHKHSPRLSSGRCQCPAALPIFLSHLLKLYDGQEGPRPSEYIRMGLKWAWPPSPCRHHIKDCKKVVTQIYSQLFTEETHSGVWILWLQHWCPHEWSAESPASPLQYAVKHQEWVCTMKLYGQNSSTRSYWH